MCQTLITELYIYYISGGRGVSDTYISHLCTWHRLNLGHLTIQDTLSQSHYVHIREVHCIIVLIKHVKINHGLQ